MRIGTITRYFPALTASVFAMLAFSVQANVIYSIDVSGAGGRSLTGTITTNGTYGLLTTANVVSWSLTYTGATDASISSTDAGAQYLFNPTFGSDLDAESGFIYVVAPPSPTDADSEFFTSGDKIALSDLNPGRTDITLLNSQNGGLDAFGVEGSTGGLAAIGTAEAVPEPATLALIGLGLAGICVARRRKTA